MTSGDLVHTGTSDTLFFKQIESYISGNTKSTLIFLSFKKFLKQNQDHTSELSIGNNLYFELHKNDKSMYLRITFSNLQKN